MMGHRERLNADEWDAFHRRSRRLLCVFSRPAVAGKTKARFNRRVRREAKRIVQIEATTG